MPNTHTTLTSLFSDIATSIRNKTGGSATIVADNFPSAIDAIPTGGESPDGSYATGITVSTTDTSSVPLVTTAGKFPVNYLTGLTIPSGKSLGAITNEGTVEAFQLSNNSSKISTLSNSGIILNLANSGMIGDYTAASSSSTGKNGLYGNGIVYIATTNVSSESSMSSSSYACSSIINKGGTSSYRGSYIGLLQNSSYAKINSVTNASNAIIASIQNSGTIGDSTTASSSSTGKNGLYGSGTVYVAATAVSSPSSSSTYALNTLTLKGGTNSYKGAYVNNLNVGSYATINNLTVGTLGGSGAKINTLTNYNTITTLSNQSSITTLNCASGSSVGTISLNHTTVGSLTTNMDSTITSLTLGSGTNSWTAPSWSFITSGKPHPTIDVSSASTLAGYLVAANAGLLFKYTGTTTTYGGVTYTQGNLYTYQA